jgi:hypothetical protein
VASYLAAQIIGALFDVGRNTQVRNRIADGSAVSLVSERLAVRMMMRLCDAATRATVDLDMAALDAAKEAPGT